MKVRFRFFQDDATGDWGVTHEDTFADNSPFNAMWSGTMFFHDVFEHWHEYQHKHFLGKNAMNVGGEMAAMGAMYYYINELGIHNRLSSRRYNTDGDIMRMTTEDMVCEAIKYGGAFYGNTLECGVPYQKPVDDGEFEYQLQKFWKNVKGCIVGKVGSREYKDSVTFRKIANLHRWGYRMAAKLIPLSRENRCTLCDFIDYWDDFCKANKAEDLANYYRGITFTLTKKRGVLRWRAVFEGIGIKNHIINQDTKSIFIDEVPFY